MFKFFIRSRARVKRIWVNKLSHLINAGSLRGIRHRDMLPVNGQRTRSNCGVSRRKKVAILTAMEERKRKEEEAKKKQEKN